MNLFFLLFLKFETYSFKKVKRRKMVKNSRDAAIV
jgi:hypothetical protein